MKNPNDSYWTSGSDVHIPEYDQAPVTPQERKMVLDRRFSDSLWRIWWPFERRERQKLVEESRG